MKESRLIQLSHVKIQFILDNKFTFESSTSKIHQIFRGLQCRYGITIHHICTTVFFLWIFKSVSRIYNWNCWMYVITKNNYELKCTHKYYKITNDKRPPIIAMINYTKHKHNKITIVFELNESHIWLSNWLI